MESKDVTPLSRVHIENLSDRLKALHSQENVYQSSDYLCQMKEQSGAKKTEKTINEKCRHIMVKWCFDIIDYYNARKETASIAISNLDRFLSSTGSVVLFDKHLFQVAVMTSLQLAFKLYEKNKLEMKTLVTLSHEEVRLEDILLMEQKMLSALQWRLCPATPYVFLDLLAEFFSPSLISNATKESLLKFARGHICLTLPHYQFSLAKPSTIAFASMLNAINQIKCRSKLSLRNNFINNAAQVILNRSISSMHPLKFNCKEVRSKNYKHGENKSKTHNVKAGQNNTLSKDLATI